MIPATFRRGKIYNNPGSAQRLREPPREHLRGPRRDIAIHALALVGGGVEVVSRVGFGEPSHPPRQLRSEPVVRAELARLHLPHNKHRQRADDDLTRGDSVAPRDHLARRNALVTNARSALPLGSKDALRVGDYVQPSVVKAVPSGTVGLRSIRARTSR